MAFLGKEFPEPGLEIADFIAHTSGSTALTRAKKGNSVANNRKDFLQIFHSGFLETKSYMEVTDILKSETTPT